MHRRIAYLIILILFGACGIAKRGTYPVNGTEKVPAAKSTPTLISASKKPAVRWEDDKISSSLKLAYKDWKGIPYVLGGTGYSGVDCSSFMQIVFEDYFSVQLPRNTREQLREGKGVKRRNIGKGDLVFFKTGRNTFHVGVMVNDQEFLHASTSVGVTISNLNMRYWQDAYLTARRILK